MANTPQAKKRIRRNEKRAEINGARMSRIRNFLKKVETAIEGGDKDSAACGDLSRGLGVHPLIGLLLLRRGHDQVEEAKAFLNPKLTDLHDPADLPGIGRAVERVDQRTIRTERHGVHSEVTPRQIFLQRHCGGGVDLESTVASPYFTFTPCQRVLLA